MELMYKTLQQETQNHYYFMISMQWFFLKSMLTTKMRSTIIVKTQNYLCLFLE